MNRILPFVVLFFLEVTSVFSQTLKELEIQLSKTSKPKKRLELLNTISKGETERNPALAITYGKKAAELALKLSDSTELGNAYNNISLGHYWMNELPRATAYTYKALNIREKQKDTLMIAESFNTLGVILSSQNRFKHALTYFERALIMAKQKDNKERIMLSLSNIGTCYQSLKQPERALQYYLEGQKINKAAKDTLNLSIDELLIGRAHGMLKNYNEAFTHLHASLRLSEIVGNEVNKMHAYRFLADTHKSLKQIKAGINAATKSLAIAKKLNSPEGIQDASLLLNKFYILQKDYQKAHQYLSLAYDSKDTLHTRNQDKALAEMNIKYETEKKESENLRLSILRDEQAKKLESETLKKKTLGVLLFFMILIAFLFYRSKTQIKEVNQQLRETNELINIKNRAIENKTKAVSKMALKLKAQNEQLDTLNKQKNTLFSIIAHDLRGPLVSLRSLLQLIQMGALPADKLEHFIKDIDTQQQNTIGLLDNLLMWARSQMDGLVFSPKPLNLNKVVSETLQLVHFQAEQKGISFYNEVPVTISVMADYEMTKLVLRNLISNAIKFCTAGDTIKIEAEHVSTETIQIVVIDTGVGISEEDQQKLFKLSRTRKKGTAQEDGSGLGLMLCKEFIEKNHGDLWVESKIGEGSKFYFTLPYSPVPVKKISKINA